MVKRSFHTKNRHRGLIIGTSVIIFVTLLTVALELTDTTHFFHKQKAISGTIPSTSKPKSSLPSSKEKTDVAPSPNAAAPPEGSKQGDATTVPPSTGAAPVDPYGNFVSNHSPSLDGNPTPSTIQSVCNTTPGAACRMEFTNQDRVIKELKTQHTDSSGATYWNWNVKQAGLTVGSWKIRVVAELNGQTRATEDVQNLEVGP